MKANSKKGSRIFNDSNNGQMATQEGGAKMARIVFTAIMATLLIGINAMAQDTDTSAETDTDTSNNEGDNQNAPAPTGLLSMKETSYLYPGTDMFYLGLNAFPKNACDYFNGSKVEDKDNPKNNGFVVRVAKKLRGNDKKDLVNLANTGGKNMCALSPIVRQKLWDVIHAWLIKKGCKPADGADVNDLNTEWSGTCGDIKAGIKAVVLKAMEYADPESRAVMKSMLDAAEDIEITSGVITLEIVFTQMPLYFAPEDVWRPLFASSSVELGTLADDASTVKVGSMAKAVCVGKKPIVGKVVANGDTISIETADGEIVEMNAKDCAVWTANSFPTVRDGLETGNKVVVLNKDDQLPTWGEITDVVSDDSGNPTNIKVELEDGTESDIALTDEQIVLGKKISSAAGSVSFSLEGTAYIGIGSTMPDNTDGVVAPTTMLIIRWTPEALKGILSFHAGFGFGFAEGNTSYGIEDASQTERMFFIGKVGASAGYDVLSWLRPEVIGSLIYTANGVGGEGGADLVFKAHKYFNIRVGARVGYIPTGVVPDTRPGRNTPALDGLFVGPALTFEFCIPY